MISYFEFLISMKFLRSKRREAFISVVSAFSLIGIMLGVATLIIVMSVMNGYHRELVKNILGIQGHISVVHKDLKRGSYVDISNEIEKISDVAFVAPIIIEQAMAVNGKIANGVVVRGIDPDKLAMKPIVREAIDLDVIKNLNDSGNVVLGVALASNMNLDIGDEIKIVTPSNSSTLIGSIPRNKVYKVTGIIDMGLYQFNSTTIFMNLSDAQKLFKYDKGVGEIEIIARNPENLEGIKSSLAKIFGQNNIRTIDWKIAQSKWLNALAVERTVMFFILTLIILVAVFNIISSLIMLVQDKSKAIAILRTMGASKKSIIKIFVIIGSAIGVIGSVLGVAIGFGVAANLENIKTILEELTGKTLFDPVIYFLSHLPSEVHLSDCVLILAMSIGFSIAATIYPAYRASKLLPVEVLRYE